MPPLDRFNYHRRRFRKKLGDGSVSPAIARHIARAAALEQVLEMAKQEMWLGHQFDAEVLSGLRVELGISLMHASIEASKASQRRN